MGAHCLPARTNPRSENAPAPSLLVLSILTVICRKLDSACKCARGWAEDSESRLCRLDVQGITRGAAVKPPTARLCASRQQRLRRAIRNLAG